MSRMMAVFAHVLCPDMQKTMVDCVNCLDKVHVPGNWYMGKMLCLECIVESMEELE